MLLGGIVAQFLVPLLIGVVLDAVQTYAEDSDKKWEIINNYCLMMLVAVVLSAVCGALRGSTFNTISEKIAMYLRYDLFYFVITKEVGYYDEHKTGDLLSRMASDTEIIQ